MKKEANKLSARKNNLDVIIQKLYEDKVLEKISEDRFFSIAASYEKEQTEISERIAIIEKEIKVSDKKEKGVDEFLKLVSTHSDITEITPEILGEFIDKILVHKKDNDNNSDEQIIDIVYRGVGVLNIR